MCHKLNFIVHGLTGSPSMNLFAKCKSYLSGKYKGWRNPKECTCGIINRNCSECATLWERIKWIISHLRVCRYRETGKIFIILKTQKLQRLDVGTEMERLEFIRSASKEEELLHSLMFEHGLQPRIIFTRFPWIYRFMEDPRRESSILEGNNDGHLSLNQIIVRKALNA